MNSPKTPLRTTAGGVLCVLRSHTEEKRGRGERETEERGARRVGNWNRGCGELNQGGEGAKQFQFRPPSSKMEWKKPTTSDRLLWALVTEERVGGMVKGRAWAVWEGGGVDCANLETVLG